MSDRTCRACAEPIAVERRSDATVCGKACATWARRHPGVLRPCGLQTYICAHCDGKFTRPKLLRAKRPRFCDDVCWEAWRHQQRPFGEWRKAVPFEPRSFTCGDCGASGEDVGTGPRATRCALCRRAHEVRRTAVWVLDNPDRSREIKLRWARRNPDAAKRWYASNRERHRLHTREYQAKNRVRVLAWKRDRQNRRRARQAAATVEVFTSEEIYARDGWVCGVCRESVDAALRWPDPMSPSLDHIVPLSRDGAHVRLNVQLAHLSCNVRKGASLP